MPLRRVPCWLLGLIALVGVAFPGLAAADTRVRVMTWNWQNASTPLYKRGWTDVVKNQKPDILGLQEICVKWVQQLVDDLARENNLHYEIAFGTWRTDWRCATAPGGTGAYGDALLIRKGAASIAHKGHFRLPGVPAASDHEERGVAWATVRIGTRSISVWDTHIGVRGAQTAQIATLARSVQAPGAGIVLGDFNSAPGDSALRPMWASWLEADPHCKSTGGCKPSHDVGKKFDYIFLRGLTASSVQAIPTPTSDHHVVIATIPI